MERLSEVLGGPSIWVKRDDCTGLAGGGNKVRKLEYLMAEARDAGADCVITAGEVQSNHARQTAAAAARAGLECHLLLVEIAALADDDFHNNGNVLLDRLHGARVQLHPEGTDVEGGAKDLADRMGAAGRRPYVVPIGGSSPLGALGYVNCAVELVAQARQLDLRMDSLIVATGSAGTQAGLLAGLQLTGEDLAVLGMCVSRDAHEQEQRVHELASRTMALLELADPLPRSTVRANSDYVGEGFGLPTPEMIEAVTLAARTEGLLLDPAYTGKAMAGLVDLVRRGTFDDNDNLVFLHTGGSPALFACRSFFDSS
jgi:L-cysteate sulfo-lyase